jgi:hypothetical protein
MAQGFSVSWSAILISSDAHDVHVIMSKSLMEAVEVVKVLGNFALAKFVCLRQETT